MSRWAIGCGVSAAATGIFFAGYHMGIVAAILSPISMQFELSLFEEQLFVALLLMGALIGSLFAGRAADYLGRRKLFFLLGICSIIGVLIGATVNTFSSLLFYRLLVGISTGATFMLSPMYIAEIGPTARRGALVSCSSFFLVAGFFVSYLVSNESNWRLLLSYSLIPLVIQFFLLYGSPPVATLAVLKKKNWGSLFSSVYRKPLVLGISLAALQQLSGINAVSFYAPHIFDYAAPERGENHFFALVLMGGVNLAATFIGLLFIDRLGRRILLLISLAGMAIGLIILNISTLYFPSVLLAPDLGILLYVGFFGLGLGPAVWLLLTEIYPIEVRAEAMGFATFVNWMSNSLVSMTFLSLSNWLGQDNVFFIYLCVCLGGVLLVYKTVPETRGKSFAEIEKLWH